MTRGCLKSLANKGLQPLVSIYSVALLLNDNKTTLQIVCKLLSRQPRNFEKAPRVEHEFTSKDHMQSNNT